MVKQKLNSTTYINHCKTWHWDFEWYMTIHQEQHMIIHGLTCQGHPGIEKMQQNMLPHEQDQDQCPGHSVHNDFAYCIVLFTDYIAQTKVSKNLELNISALGTQKEKKVQLDDQKCKAVEDQYYMANEYHLLIPKQKLKQKEMWVPRDIN